MFARLRARIDALTRRTRFEEAMRTEMQFHVDAYADDLVKGGMRRAEAERRARMEFGTADALKDDCRQSRGLRLFDEALQDLRYAVRLMRKTPAVTLAAIVSLALGIGANTAIFTLVDAVLLRGLPVTNPNELFFLGHGSGERPSTSSNYPLFERYARLTDVFDGVTAYAITGFKVPTNDRTENIEGIWVTGNFHAVVGVPMALGRGFAAESDRALDGSPIAVISHQYWIRRFGGSPDVLDRTIAIDDAVVSIVGVTAATFAGLVPGQVPDITLPMSMRARSQPEFLSAHDTWTSMPIVGRLKAGVTETQAQAAIDVVLQQYLSEPDNRWITKRDPEGFRTARLASAARGSSALRQRYATPLAVLMSMVGLILLIASVNVANLLMVRSEARTREVAIRLCVGCGRRRLIRQFLSESIFLALCGAAAGFLLAIWGTQGIMAIFRSLETPVQLDVSPNLRVLAFTTGISLLTGLFFGLVPALKSTRVDLTPALKDGPSLSFGARRRWRTGQLLLVAQVAVCVVVTAVGGLLVRSLYNLKSVDAGFHGEKVLVLTLDADRRQRTPDQRAAIYAETLDRMKTLPGVTTVAASTSTPIHTSGNARVLAIPGVPETDNARLTWMNFVTPEYFETMGIRLMRGRNFSNLDTKSSRRVAIINEVLARAYFGDRDSLGQTIAFEGQADNPLTVVGVAQNTYQRSLREAIPRMIYMPLPQGEAPRWISFSLRTTQRPSSLAAAAAETAHTVANDSTVRYVRTMDEQVDASLVLERLLATLSTSFGVLALVLASVGLYGVMSYQVSRRRREIGIRIALGARRANVLWQVMRPTLVVSILGVGIGLAAATLITRFITTLLFGLTPNDPTTFAGVAILLIVTGMVAGFLPARRAATMDPVRAIKTE